MNQYLLAIVGPSLRLHVCVGVCGCVGVCVGV